jgi:hypothetical protein
MISLGDEAGPVGTWINALLLVAVIGFPITFLLVVKWLLGRHGVDMHHEPRDLIDYNKG